MPESDIVMAPAASFSTTLADLAARTGATLDGDGTTRIERVATLEHAGPAAIAFLANPKYRGQLATTRAAAVIVSPAEAKATALPKLVSGNPYATYAKVAALLHPAQAIPAGVHPAAVIHPTAQVAADVAIGPQAVVGPHAVIGAAVKLGAGCVIGEEASIGTGALLHANVTVYPGCVIGPRTIIHSGAVIGADGFGMAEEEGCWVKVPQLGRVVIGADCEIGANTTIDRGAIDDTVLGDDVKIDNQVQIGHNCVIGAHTAIAGCTGVSGTVRIGRNCKIGGAAMIGGHIEIADGTTISGGTTVFESITEPGVYTSMYTALPHPQWRRAAVALRHLHDLIHRVSALERAVAKKESEGSHPVSGTNLTP